MTSFNVPTRANVSPANQNLFDALQKGLGMVPNLYATLAHNETALGDYLTDYRGEFMQFEGRTRSV